MRILGTTAALVLGGGLLAAAAEPATLGIGSRVRVQQGPGKHGARLVGLVTATDAETLTLTLDQGQTRVVPWNTVQKIHVSRGRRSVGAGALRGAGIGLLTGVAAGALMGTAAGDDPPCGRHPDLWICIRFTAEEKAGLGAYVFGIAGTTLGAATGAAVRGERWAPAGEARVRLSAQPGPGGRGTGLSLSVAF